MTASKLTLPNLCNQDAIEGWINQDIDMTENIPNEPDSSRLQVSSSPRPAAAPTHFPYLSVGDARLDTSPKDVTVQGSATVSGDVTTTSLHQTSDQRAKCNILPANHCALSIIQQIQIYQYNLKQNPSGQKQLGVLAHEVCHLFPDAVKTDDSSGMEQVSSHSMLYLAIKAIQQLSCQLSVHRACTNGRLGLSLLAAGGMSEQSAFADASSLGQRSTQQQDSEGGQCNPWHEDETDCWEWARDPSEECESNWEEPNIQQEMWGQATAAELPEQGRCTLHAIL